MTAAPARRAIAALTGAALAACSRAPARPAASSATAPALRCDELKSGWDCFLRVPAGAFVMGAQSTDPNAPAFDPDARADEGPPHRVQLREYWITRSEVSLQLWLRCRDEGRCRAADRLATAPDAEPPSRPGFPANGLSWRGANDLCAWLGGRLPTEAEWERAARGDDDRRYPWGADPRCVAATVGDLSTGRAVPSGPCALPGPSTPGELRHPSPFGALGMAGNLWEWVEDAYDPSAWSRRAAGLVADPVVTEGTTRVQRGGAFTTEPVDQRVTARAALPPDQLLHDVGVRCAWSDAP